MVLPPPPLKAHCLVSTSCSASFILQHRPREELNPKLNVDEIRGRRWLSEYMQCRSIIKLNAFAAGSDFSREHVCSFAKQLTACNFGVYSMDWIGSSLAEAIIDSAGVIARNPGLTICYDEIGSKYELPKYVLCKRR